MVNMEGVAQSSHSCISKLNSRRTAPVDDAVGGKLDPTGTAGSVTSETGCIMVAVQRTTGIAYCCLVAFEPI